MAAPLDEGALRATLDAGLAHHYAGRLADAEATYRQVLAAAPRHPDALHLLGMIAYQRRDFATAVGRLGEALRIRPGDAVIEQDLGTVLQAQGQLDAALAHYDRALAQDPALADARYNRGTVLETLGRRDEALACYSDLVARDPSHAAAHHRRAVVLQALGRHGDAAASYRSALAREPRAAEAHVGLGDALRESGDPQGAAQAYRAALALRPTHAQARNNLGAMLQVLGDHDGAIASYREAARLEPSFVAPHDNLAVLLAERAPDEAIAALRRVVRLAPGRADAHRRLGRVLLAQGDAEAAVDALQRAVALAPEDAAARTDLGIALHAQGRLDAAVAVYRDALAHDAAYVPALGNLAGALAMQGDVAGALQRYREALALSATPPLQAAFAACVANAPQLPDDPSLRPLLLQALAVPWARPADLARPVAQSVRAGGAIAELVARTADPAAATWDGAMLRTACRTLGEDTLLRAVLVQAPLADPPLERVLVAARRALLEAAAAPGPVADEVVTFGALLARQCFVNEYLFATRPDDDASVVEVRATVEAALARDADVPPVVLVALAAFAPLHRLSGARALAERTWPDEVDELVRVQVREPLEEARLRAGLTRLTAVDDPVSREVQAQYEESPYPRWVAVPRDARPRPLAEELRARFPRAGRGALPERLPLDVLIAGAGTGQEVIETALRHPGARILAVDLSAASLAYGQRAAAAHGLAGVEFAQADILGLGSLERRFDVISSVGVLHHLDDPAAGLRVLASLLRPDGVMQVGLYSERARRDITAARDWAANEGYRATPADVRRCRATLLAQGPHGRFARLAAMRDFHSTSALRDLLFNVREQRFTLPAIARMIESLRLDLIGFVLPPPVLAQYRARFPEDRAATDLARWDAFEADHPETFTGMYVFWVRRRAA